MKILHVVSYLNPDHGGVCQGLRLLVSGLTQQGVDNEVASLDAPNASYLGSDSFPVHALGPGKGPWHYGTRLIPWLIENLSRFDAVIVHGIWLYHGYAVQRATAQLKRMAINDQSKGTIPPVYIFPQGMLDPYFQRAPGRKLKAFRNWLHWKLIERNVINEADGILFTAETERRVAYEPFSPYRPKREIVMGMGVETPPLYTYAMREAFNKTCPELGDQPYLLFLSRIHEKKGVDLLLEAYRQLSVERKENATVSLTVGALSESTQTDSISRLLPLVIAGPGLDTAYGQKMQQLVAESPELRKSVFFPGMITGDAKWGALYNCSAFVLPTHQENFGIAIVEALACGKPVLISNQTNIWHAIDQGKGGIVVTDTVEGTHQMLKRWLNLSADEQGAIGKRAQSVFENNFSISQVARRLLESIHATH